MIKNGETVCRNKKVSFEYTLEEKIEAGIILLGTEVKSLRNSRAIIDGAYIGDGENGKICIYNLNIPEYKFSSHFNHSPKRTREILLHKKQKNKMLSKVRMAGYAIIPLSMYFNKRGFVKLSIALAKGKKTIDRRETIKEREWNRQKSRIMKHQDY